MSERANDETFEQLAAGYFDEVLDDRELQQLKRLLAEDDQRVQRFAELAQLHQMIESEITYQRQAQRFDLSKSPNDSSAANALAELASLYEDELQNPVNFTAWRQEQAIKAQHDRHRVQRKRLLITSALAALIALAGVLAIQFITNNPAPQDIAVNTPNKPAESAPPIPRDHPGITPVATLTNTNHAQWGRPASARTDAGPEHPPKTGSKLHPNQRLTLTAGFAEITTNRGAIAILQAPATIELLNNDNAIELHSGKLVGICETESSKGLLVRTPHMDVVDLGTEFGLAVTHNRVEATVFSGEIEVKPLAGVSQRLASSQTARLAIDGNKRTLAIEDRVASGFDALRDEQLVLITMPRLGTGVGFAQDTIDPRYHITAIAGKTLKSPLPLRVGQPIAKIESDPLAPTQMVKHYPTDGKLDAVYRIETTLRLPVRFDAEREQLVLRFRADNELLSLTVNGQSVQVPEQKTAGYGQDYRMLIDGSLQPGDNHIVFEVRNQGENTPENPVGIQAVWELQPKQTKQKE